MPTEEQLRRAEEIRAGVTHDTPTYLKRISDDMSAMRKQFDKLFTYIDRAESLVPEHYRRLSMVFHDLHDVRNAYIEFGIPCPPYLDRAIELFADAFKHATDDLEAPGGHFYKARQDIVKRGDYRYDHNQPLLSADKRAEEKANETRTEQQHDSGAESRAPDPGRVNGSGSEHRGEPVPDQTGPRRV